MRRAWRWYWRTTGGYWRQMTRRTRLVFLAVALIGFGVPIAFIVVPSARIPLLIGYVVLFAADIPIALRRSRRKRG